MSFKDNNNPTIQSTDLQLNGHAPPQALLPSAPEQVSKVPPPRPAPAFVIEPWNVENEPVGMTRLRGGENFLDGIRRIGQQIGEDPVSKGCKSILPGMRVSDDQIGVILSNGLVRLRPPGAYRSTVLNPLKTHGAVIPVDRRAGVEFDPLAKASEANRNLRNLQLGQSYRQIVLQKQQVGVFQDQSTTVLANEGTYVYCPDTELRGVIDLQRMNPVIVERETEDTAAATMGVADVRINQHGRQVPLNQGHGTKVETTKRYIPSGYTMTVAGITVARPATGFVVLHKNGKNEISMSESICMASGNQEFVRCAINELNRNMTIDELEIEFGDLNHYAKSTPMLELKSKDNLDALCRAQIKWRQVRPDIWVSQRGAFTDPFDMLEEKCANMMRDWLLGVPYLDALEEKAAGFTKVEHAWNNELNDTGAEYGVEVLGIEITTLRFPNIDKQDELMANQLAETNLAIESSRQDAMREKETSKLNQTIHERMQEDKVREAEAEERQQQVQRRKNIAEAETVTKKAEMDTAVVKAEMDLALAKENKDKEVALAKATAMAEADRVRAQGQRDAAVFTAEGEIAATKEKNMAQLDFLKEQATLLKENPGLVDLLKLQNDLLKTEQMAKAATVNPNVVLLSGQEGLEARRMNKGHAPQVPGATITTHNGQ